MRAAHYVTGATGVVAALGVLVALSLTVPTGPSESQCAPTQQGGPMWVTADCVDPDYSKPVIDEESDLTNPVPVHKVSGHFDGTDKKFNIYLPPKDKWQGRFFQYVYPLIDENITDDNLAFDVVSGGYGVQTNGGSGYRVDAAAAKFAKTVAAEYYSTSQPIYGYLWGGSGGSYQTISAAENSTGVWDGAVPFIVGAPTSIPNNFFIRALGALVLKDRAPQIADAVAPGGSGDPDASLNDTQKAVLAEMTRMGVPLRAFEDYQYVLGLGSDRTPAGLLGFRAQVEQIDPTYADDFWSKPGYLGTEQSALGDFIRAGRVRRTVTVTGVDKDTHGNPIGLAIDSAPANPYGTGLDLTVYAADGTTYRGSLNGDVDTGGKTITLTGSNSADVLAALSPGAELRIDNLWHLALPAYPRYQVPTQPGFHSFDQYRNATGAPIYPQRPVQTNMAISQGVAEGGTHTGKINGKMIAVCNLLDTDAFAWHGDWYGKQVHQALGDTYDDRFRLWLNDNADHIAPGRTNRLIDYTGILQQALRDVAAWAEKGVEPPESTRYQEKDSQISVPAKATERRGIQPVVELDAGGKDRVEIAVGQPVAFHAKVQVPPSAGKVVSAEWDFAGEGDFTPVTLDGDPRETVEFTQTFTYNKPGTYFAQLHATAQRDGGASSPYTKVQNLGRIRVVVR